MGAFELADGRGSAPFAVRVFNPTLADDGYATVGTVVETNCEDSPFLVDSVSEELARPRARRSGSSIHPVIGTERDADGRIRAGPARPRGAGPRVGHALRGRAATSPGRSSASSTSAHRARARRRPGGGARLRGDDGSRAADDRGGAAARRPLRARRDRGDAGLPRVAARRELRLPRLPRVRARRRASSRSSSGRRPRHPRRRRAARATRRRCPLGRDRAGAARARSSAATCWSSRRRTASRPCTGARRWTTSRSSASTPGGNMVGELRLLGLFTRKAYMEPASRIPILGRKLRQIAVAEDFLEGSHDHKALVELFESFPKDELFAAGPEELRETLVSPARPPGAAAHPALRPAATSRRIASPSLVALPRDRFNAELRHRLQELLQRALRRLVGRLPPLARRADQARHPLHGPRATATIPDVSFAELEQEVVALARTWDDRLARAARRRCTARSAGDALADKYAQLLPDYYKSSTDVYLARARHRAVRAARRRRARSSSALQNERGQDQNLTRVGLYKTGGKVQLSDFLPILEAPRARRSSRRCRRGCSAATARRLPARLRRPRPGRAAARPAGLRRAGRGRDRRRSGAARRSPTRSTGSSSRPGSTGARWRCSAPTGSTASGSAPAFTEEYQNDAFARNPAHRREARRAVRAALRPRARARRRGRADPARSRSSPTSTPSARSTRTGSCAPSSALVDATVRTNAFRAGPALPLVQAPLGRGAGHAEAVPAVRDLRVLAGDGGHPPPRRPGRARRDPLVGPHGGLPHRGPRPDEGADGEERRHRARRLEGRLRAEARARRPGGAEARGRRAVLDAHARPARPHRQPRRRGEVVHPPDVRDARRRRPVPRRRRRQGHGDVLRHRERHRGRVRVLARRRLRLRRLARLRPQGARHHRARRLGVGQAPLPRARARRADRAVHRRRHRRHVRRRLRQRDAAVRADPPGRGVRPPARVHRPESGSGGLLRRAQAAVRAARVVMGRLRPLEALGRRRRLVAQEKSIPLAAGGAGGARRRARGAARPTELMSAILRAPVDLFWNGGIGTFVKATDETNADVGDRTNDADPGGRRRTCGHESSARAATSASRSAGGSSTPSTGGRINTDFIDNSAGVDCSDHEVNLKILLGIAVAAGDLTTKQRDELLDAVEADVAAHVLYDNYLQAQILSQEAAVSSARIEAYEDLMAQPRGGRAARPRDRGPAADRGDGRAGPRPGAAWNAPSSACCSRTPSAASRRRSATPRSRTTRTSTTTCGATSRRRSSSGSAT